MPAGSKDIHGILRDYWGYDSFRPLQREIIDSVLQGRDTLGLLPTGGGKSITFQVPALALDGLTLVVTPLISLMKDQVDNLRALGVKAAFIHSGMPRREGRLALDRSRLGKVKLLYLSPERLNSEAFLAEARTWRVSLIVVDEAHCISQWGYDFRPSYLKIASLRELFKDVPVLALTASATPDVVADIQDKLQFRPGAGLFSKSFRRSNISYLVRNVDVKPEMVLKILSSTAGTAIVYVRSRVRAHELADYLAKEGISAEYYHAGLATEEKDERQNRWKNSQTRVMVATNAFGMGIDKADVRTVVHVDLPSSLEEYYQEAGRAGRDGKPSYAVIVTSRSDKAALSRRIADSFPPKETILEIYDRVGVFLDVAVGEGFNRVYDFNEAAFCKRFGYRPAVVRSALSILTGAGYIEYNDDISSRARVMMLMKRDELYDLSLDEASDRVLTTLLRAYTGLFAEYVYIDEHRIASFLPGMTDTDVYQAFLTLGRMHVLHYVPRRLTPYIFYTTSRELPRYVTIPKAVYEDRRDNMERRIKAMKDFVYDDSRCREAVMLGYFGENEASECGRCDYCRAKARRRLSEGDRESLRGRIEKWASAPGGITAREAVERSGVSEDETRDAIRSLLDEGVIRVGDAVESRLFKS